jgi:iron complex transport system substrate-binding protein
MVAMGLGHQLVGISGDCVLPPDLTVPRLTPGLDAAPDPKRFDLSGLAEAPTCRAELMQFRPDLVCTSLREELDSTARADNAKVLLQHILPEAKLLNFFPRTLEQIYGMYEGLGKITKCQKGHDLAQKLKAQVMDWGDNFYERMKNKKVCFLSSAQPLKLAGLWIPDLINSCSALSQFRVAGQDTRLVQWQEILDFKPDVIIVAPEGQGLDSSLKLFKQMEKLPEWETVPAVKRGEVIFTDGNPHFYSPGPTLRDSISILVSAISGFESGYIAPRDSFYRLRWLELQRHKF